ncbi:MAG: restriction endonuclease subunit S [Candidatus Saccharimonadales bacterium]
MKTVKLGDVCEFKRGLTYKKTDEVAMSSNVVLRANNIDLSSFRLNFDELKYISDEIDIPESKYVQKDTILICTASGSKIHLGKVALVDRDYGFAFGGFMGLLAPDDKQIEAKYLYRILTSKPFRSLIDSLTDGANINNLKFSLIEDFEFVLPSLEEQRAIVRRLDAAFEKISAAEVLTRQNLDNVSALQKSILHNCLSGSADTQVKRLGIVFTIGSSKRVLKSQWQKAGVPFYRGREITRLSTTGEANNDLFISEDLYADYASKYGVPQANDIMITAIGTLGNSYVVSADDKFYFKDASVLWMKKNEEVNSRYVDYWIKSSHFKSQLEPNGTTVNTLTIGKLQSLEIDLPSIENQDAVVGELDVLTGETQKVEAKYRKKLAKLSDLRQSLLAEAFSTTNTL